MTAPPPRLLHVDGEWLLARDLRDEPDLASERLAQHHIAAHRTWGVSAGLRVAVRGGLLVVTAGFAVDRRGRIGVLPELVCERLQRADLPAAVVLRVVGNGPAARIRVCALGEPARDSDVPLARLDAKAGVRAGDSDRQWLRRPGPTRTLAGLIDRGAPVASGSTPLLWTVHVDLAELRLDGHPAVSMSIAGEPPPTTLLAATADVAGATFVQSVTAAIVATTLEADAISSAGFDVIVRHHAAAGTQLAAVPGIRVAAALRVAPVAVSWLAVVPARRPAAARRKALT